MKFGFATSTLQEDPVSSCFSFEPTPNGKINAVPISNWSSFLMNSINEDLKELWAKRKEKDERTFEKKLDKYLELSFDNFSKAIKDIDTDSEGNLYFYEQIDISIILEALDQKSNHVYSDVFISFFRKYISRVNERFEAKFILFVNQFSSELIRNDHNIDVINKLISQFSEKLEYGEDKLLINTLASRDIEGWKYYVDQCKKFNNINAFRLSIEWAEIFPRRNEFNDTAAEKYCQIIEHIYDSGIEAVICTDHMSWPLWLGKGRGWTERESINDHDRYITELFRFFKNRNVLEKISKVIVFNEPYTFLPASYLDGIWPPYFTSNPLPYRGLVGLMTNYSIGRKIIKIFDGNNPYVNSIENTSRAHVSAYRIIKGIDDNLPITSSQIHTFLEANPKTPPARTMQYFARKFRNVWWQLTIKKDPRNLIYDFEAIQYYGKLYLNLQERPRSIMQHVIDMDKKHAFANGWINYSENFVAVVFERSSLYLKLMMDYGVKEEEQLPKLSFTEFGFPASATWNLSIINKMVKAIATAENYIPMEIDMILKWCPIDNMEWDCAYNNLLRFGNLNYDFTKKKVSLSTVDELDLSDKVIIKRAKQLQTNLHAYYDFLLEEDADDLFVVKINKYSKKIEEFINTNS